MAAGMRSRRSIRLPEYDYAQDGVYFITICTRGRECLLGMVNEGRVELTEYGPIVQEEWSRSTSIRAELSLGEFVVMPNHLHGIVEMNARSAMEVGAHGRAPLRALNSTRPLHRQKRSLGSFIAGFKSACTKRINQRRASPGTPVWQRNYYEHIVRDENDLSPVRQYIVDNPLEWELDEYRPAQAAGHA